MPKAKAKRVTAVQKRLDELVFYAVDQASPYALAMSGPTDNVDKIADYTLLSLGITEQGAAIMWLWINAHCQPDALPVGADVASRCMTVAEVRAAVRKNIVAAT